MKKKNFYYNDHEFFKNGDMVVIQKPYVKLLYKEYYNDGIIGQITSAIVKNRGNRFEHILYNVKVGGDYFVVPEKSLTIL